MLMTTGYDLLKLNCFAEDALESTSAYAYDTYSHIVNLHTDRDGSGPAQEGFSIRSDDHSSCSGTADTITWYAYNYNDVSRFLSRDPIGENGFELARLGNNSGNKNVLPSTVNRQAAIPNKGCHGNKCANGATDVSLTAGGNFVSRSINSFQTRTPKAYGFAQNNPIIRIDPLGLDDCVCRSGSHKGRHTKPGYTPTANGCTGVGSGPFDFTSACYGHDICYGTCNSDKSACDSNFYNDMMNICSQNCGTDVNCLFWCGLAADVYYAGVFWAGSLLYDAAQNAACEDCCCP